MSLTSSFDYSGPMTETVLMGNIAIRSFMEMKKIRKEMHFIPEEKIIMGW